MSSIDFSRWSEQQPKFARGWALLRAWSEANPKARTIIPVAVLRFAFHGGGVPISEALSLMSALEFLVGRGALQRRFAVVSPAGTVLAPYYETRAAIPRQVRNAFDEVIDTSVSDIEPVFVTAGGNGGK